jgi:uncharacterized protein
MTKTRTIWIDLDNSPHVPLFIPILADLEKRGHRVLVTTRDCFQVCSLADYYRLEHRTIGRHYGANKFLKVLGTLWRSIQLAPVVLKERPSLSISHGSRSLILLSWFLNIPTILMFDYEHAKSLPFMKPVLGIAPEAITDPELATHFTRGLRSYEGLKEDVYVPFFKPDATLLRKLELREDSIIVTIRPPATEAHYHNPESERLFVEVVNFLGGCPDVRMVILPRNEKTQRDLVYKTWPLWCEQRKIIVPDQVLDGLNLIWHSDLVVSAGGTMNREAASLGVPVYSIFRGKLGAVDRYLADKGRLTLVETVEEISTKIVPVKRPKRNDTVGAERLALTQIVAAVEEVIQDTQPDPRWRLRLRSAFKTASVERGR